MAKLSQKKRAQFAADVADLDAYLTSNGAEKGTDKRWNIDDFFTVWDMPTRFGRLEITVVTDGDDMICARFMDELSDEDKKRVPANDDLNRYSLKWNCLVSKDGKADFHEAVIAFKDRVSKILKVVPNLKPAADVWYVAKTCNDTQGLINSESTGAYIAVTYRPEYAPIIVHCVNHHAALVEALEWMMADGTPDHKCGGHGGSSCCCSCARDKARAILATAKPQ